MAMMFMAYRLNQAILVIEPGAAALDEFKAPIATA